MTKVLRVNDELFDVVQRLVNKGLTQAEAADQLLGVVDGGVSTPKNPGKVDTGILPNHDGPTMPPRLLEMIEDIRTKEAKTDDRDPYSPVFRALLKYRINRPDTRCIYTTTMKGIFVCPVQERDPGLSVFDLKDFCKPCPMLEQARSKAKALPAPRFTECQYCHTEVPEMRLSEHEKGCPQRTVKMGD